MELQKAQRETSCYQNGSPGSEWQWQDLLSLSYLLMGWQRIGTGSPSFTTRKIIRQTCYAHLGDYSVVTIGPPFSPAKYVEAIELCEGSWYGSDYYRQHLPRVG